VIEGFNLMTNNLPTLRLLKVQLKNVTVGWKGVNNGLIGGRH
jgi:hypothetical protein